LSWPDGSHEDDGMGVIAGTAVAGTGGDTGAAGAAVLVVLLVIWVGKSAWKHNNAGARLAALLGLILACWFIFAAADPSGGGLVAADAAKGVTAFAVGLGKVLRML
jgi:hypothetical protein